MVVVETVLAGHGDLPLGLPCWLATQLEQSPISVRCRALDEAAESARQQTLLQAARSAHMKRARSAAADFDSVLSALRSAASVHVARQGEVVVLSAGTSPIVSLESDDAIRETLAAAAEPQAPPSSEAVAQAPPSSVVVAAAEAPLS